MPSFNKDVIRGLVAKAYEDGYHGCLDLKDEYADEVLAQFSAEKPEAEWRVYTPKQLRDKPVGTVFEHSKLGMGKVIVSGMEFLDGRTFHFNQPSFPWDVTMREVNSTEG